MWLFNNRKETSQLHDLIAGCIKQQPAAQRRFVDLYYGYVSTICRLYSQNHDEVQEMMNDAFLKVLHHIHEYQSDRPLNAWMRTIIVHCCIDYFRKYGRMAGIYPLSVAETIENDSDVLSAMAAEEVLALVHKLPPSSRIVFLLHVVEGYQHKEIADMLEIQEGTSKSNLRYARIKLRVRKINRFC